MTRVLLITDRYPPHAGGVARSAQRLATHAATGGWNVHVLVTRCDSAPGSLDSSREGSLWTHRLGAPSTAADAGQLAAHAIAWLHERERFDLLHGHYASTSGFLATYNARLLGLAGYVGLRGNDLDRDIYEPSRFSQLLWTLQNADAVGAVSRALVTAATQFAGRDDVRYTPNAVDGTLFEPAPPDATLRAKLGLDDSPIIGFAGELRHKKGAEFLLAAFRAVVAQIPAQLLIVGEIRSTERRALDQLLLDEPTLADRIKVHPYTQDPAEIAALYNLMNVAVCPSLWEGMPNFVLEAMACARPVLASDAGGLLDLIEHGANGWIVSRHALHQLGAALLEVLQMDATDRAAIGAKARERVLQEFTPEREQRELLAAYAAAIG